MYWQSLRTMLFLTLLLSLSLAHGKKFKDAEGGYEQQGQREEPYERPSRGRANYPDAQGNGHSSAPNKSLSQAIEEARSRSGGRVLSAEPYRDPRGNHYRIKVLTPAGRVQTIFIDAE